MSKGKSGVFPKTKGDIIDLILNLPFFPDEDFLKNWDDITHPEAKKNTQSRQYRHQKTGLEVRFDPAQEGKPGFAGKNHYHVLNPDRTGKKDAYLDTGANPVPKGSDPSHIIPKRRR